MDLEGSWRRLLSCTLYQNMSGVKRKEMRYEGDGARRTRRARIGVNVRMGGEGIKRYKVSENGSNGRR